MRHVRVRRHVDPVEEGSSRLPGGLHCGVVVPSSARPWLPGVPPAFRAGSIAAGSRCTGRPRPRRFLPPSEAGSIAAALLGRAAMKAMLRFLPPSEVGSIAACSRRSLWTPRGAVPPAFRGGLHCGRFNTATLDPFSMVPPAFRGGLHCGTLEQAVRASLCRVPPAFRGGLHCGSYKVSFLFNSVAGSSRLPGRAPLRLGGAGRAPATAARFLPPSGAGSIAAGSPT